MECPAFHAPMSSICSSTTSTFPDLEDVITLLKSWKSRATSRLFISCSTPWWKLSALVKVCPGSKYLSVISSVELELWFTILASVVRRHQLLFCAVQMSIHRTRWGTLRTLCRHKCHLLCLPPSDPLMPDHRDTLFLWSFLQVEQSGVGFWLVAWCSAFTWSSCWRQC